MSEARAPDASAPAGASGLSDVEVSATPFDMVVRNDLDRYRPAMDVIDRVPGLTRCPRRGRAPGDGGCPHPPPRVDP